MGMSSFSRPARIATGALVLLLVVSAAALLVEPASLRTPWAWLIPPVLVVLIGGYGALVVAVRPPSAGDAVGVWCGLLAGGCWCVEIFGGGPAKFSRPVEVAVGAAFSLAATAITVAAGPIAVARERTRAAGVHAGVYAGLVSAVVVFLFAVPMTLSTLGLLSTRSDYQHQYATSGAPSMRAFLVQDILAAMCSHLVINLMLGLIGAGLASLVAVAVRVRRTEP
jgi:hypothetical protein